LKEVASLEGWQQYSWGQSNLQIQRLRRISHCHKDLKTRAEKQKTTDGLEYLPAIGISRSKQSPATS